MVMIQSNRHRKQKIFDNLFKNNSSSLDSAKKGSLPNIRTEEKAKKKKKLKKVSKNSIVETKNGEVFDSSRLPPLEPANVPLKVPEYLENDLDKDDLWNGLPDISQFDDYLDGRESGLSFGSLWSNQDDGDRAVSSLESWGEDEFDKAASKGVADMFAEIDSSLYEGEELKNNPGMASECKDWSTTFPHLRIIGKQVFPSEEKGYKLYPRPPSVTLAAPIKKSASKARDNDQLEIHGRTMEPILTPRKVKKKEETLAAHGTYEELIALDNTDILFSESENMNQLAVQKKNLISELMSRLWPEIISKILPIIRTRSNQQPLSSKNRRRHSEPVLYSSLPPKIPGIPDRKSPESLSFRAPEKSLRKAGSIRFSPVKSRQVGSVGTKNIKGRSEWIKVSAGASRRLNPMENVTGNNTKLRSIAQTQKTGQMISHLPKLPPIDLADGGQSLKEQRSTTSYSLQNTKLKRRPKPAWQNSNFDSTVAQYNLSPRKQVEYKRLPRPTRTESELKNRTKCVVTISKSEVTIPAASKNNSKKNQEKKKLKTSKSASPRRKPRTSSIRKSSKEP